MRFVTLAGNPNSGKTSLFNAVTGAHQHVGNYAGVTVELKEGTRHHRGFELKLMDLPGTYSLATNSLEEKIARDVLVTEKPDVTVSVVDASNLERNLYLTVQLLELGLPIVVALNMIDVARSRGTVIDAKKLAILLRAPVVKTIARRGEGVRELLDAKRIDGRASTVAVTRRESGPWKWAAFRIQNPKFRIFICRTSRGSRRPRRASPPA